MIYLLTVLVIWLTAMLIASCIDHSRDRVELNKIIARQNLRIQSLERELDELTTYQTTHNEPRGIESTALTLQRTKERDNG